VSGIPLVRASSVHAFLETLASVGAPVDALLADARLPARSEISLDGLFAYQQLLDFMGSARRKTGLWQLPLLAAQRADLAGLGTWGRVIGHASTLGDLIDRTIASFRFYTSGARWWTIDRGEDIVFCHQFDQRLDLAGSDVVVLVLAHMMNAVRRVLGPAWQPAEITAGSAPSLSLEPLGIAIPVPVTGITSIAIERSLLSTPTARVLGRIGESDRDQLRSLSRSSPQDDFVGSLHQALTPLIAQHDVGIDALAEITRLKVRTLQRKLSERGITFRSVLQELRFTRVLERLQDPAVKLVDVGFEVGFSDPAHFTRAFRRWTGLSPREFRRIHYSSGERPVARRTALRN